MNGMHDMGGMHGFGPIDRTEPSTVFHAPWEGRVRSMMTLLMRRRLFNVDEMRRAIESLPPAQYLTYTYFERWLAALRMLLEEKGACTAGEIERARRAGRREPERASPRRVRDAAAATPPPVARRASPAPPASASAAPRYHPGDPVVTRLIHPKEHTRLPRYARGKRGVIDRLHGIQTFPDTNAHGRGEHPQPVYSVRFAARELWGAGAAPHDAVYIDLWESYLEPA
jgi:nitrile hydratase